MRKDRRIFITGSGGMVGESLVSLLRDSGYTNLLTPSSAELDLRDAHATDAFFHHEKPDTVLHLAARVGGIKANVADPVGFLADNLAITSNVIMGAHRHDVHTLINLGSSCIYPRECLQPMKEEYLLTGPLEPTNEGYALGKIAALKMCQYLHAQEGRNYFTLVPPNLYGIHERMDLEVSHVIAGIMLRLHAAKTEGKSEVILWGTGSPRREFLCADDLVRAIAWFMEHVEAKDIPGNFLNIGSGTDLPIKDLAELISRVVGFTGTLTWDPNQPDGMPRKLMDCSRSHAFPWRPSVSLEAGISQMYGSFLSKQS